MMMMQSFLKSSGNFWVCLPIRLSSRWIYELRVLLTNLKISDIWGFHSGEDSSRGHLGCDTV